METHLEAEAEQAIEDATLPFIGRWTRLVSTTNWDKGQIIQQWRQALIQAEAPAAEYADDAWSRRVGGVSPQHVGRLRRVFDLFGKSREQFSGLFWSHFQAALDWDDAEMWLEGAVQNDWSVANMRKRRWEALGAPEDKKPREQDIISSEMDEDAESGPAAEELPPDLVADSVDQVQDPRSPAGPDFGDEDDVSSDDYAPATASSGDAVIDPLRPFEGLPELPEDLQEAFESFKVSIVRHKSEGWQEVPLNDVVRTLDALKHFATAS